MVATKNAWKTSKNSAVKTSKKEAISEVITGKDVEKHDSNVSILTKTTGPKVVIQSENLKPSTIYSSQSIRRHRVLKSVFMVVMGIIILITFFLSLKTYNTVNELYQLFSY